jgi:hypothetical protein
MLMQINVLRDNPPKSGCLTAARSAWSTVNSREWTAEVRCGSFSTDLAGLASRSISGSPQKRTRQLRLTPLQPVKNLVIDTMDLQGEVCPSSGAKADFGGGLGWPTSNFTPAQPQPERVLLPIPVPYSSCHTLPFVWTSAQTAARSTGRLPLKRRL